MRRVVVVQGERGHQRVERDRAGVVGDHQRAAVVGDVLEAGDLGAEPVLVQRAQQRQQNVLGELRVEAEVVDLVVAGEPAAQEGERRRRAGAPTRLHSDAYSGSGSGSLARPGPARGPDRSAPGRRPVR